MSVKAPERAARPAPGPADIKQVPPQPETREALRRAAAAAAAGLDRQTPLVREDLEAAGRTLLGKLDLPETYLGFAMVALNNAFWHDAFAAVPFSRRLFLLPHCLRDQAACAAKYDSLGLHCAGCGQCLIHGLKSRAEALGYRVIVAEGTSAVSTEVLEQERDAVLGVACLDSLEKSFTHVVNLGLPHLAAPLLTNGCVSTTAETAVIEALLTLRAGAAAPAYRTYVPLLREASRLFSRELLPELLLPYLDVPALEADGKEPLTITAAVALDWMKEGGRRLRPFVTLAAYAVARHGAASLASDAPVTEMIPDSVRRLALAIEVLHKASLVHDDIEDDGEFRYGRRTVHRAHGVPLAVNVGDYLVGLGYRLIAGTAAELDAQCAADVLNHLSAAHLELCRGQGAELLAHGRRGDNLRPLDVLAIGALKTAPAFETALHAGLRAAGVQVPAERLKRFAMYVGEGYQVLNDLDDWEADAANKVTRGHDALIARPTILRALALESGGAASLACAAAAGDPAAVLAQVRQVYADTGAFARARLLLEKLQERALKEARAVDPPVLRELFEFLVRVILEPRHEPPVS